MDLRSLLSTRIDGAAEAIASLREHLDELSDIATAVVGSLEGGGTVFTAGNGGSAAQALHLSEELIGRYRTDRPPCRAVCLNADPTALTCIANDFGFERTYARQCEALARAGDVFVGLSTSGNSENIVAAFIAARAAGAVTVGLLGKDGGRCVGLCDLSVIIPGTDSAHIQEAHQVVVHLICEAVEHRFTMPPTS